MALKIEKEVQPGSQATLIVTVEPERLQKELQAAAKRISKKVNIPGFRKGKAPYHIVLRYFGEDAIFEEALEPLGQSVYAEAVKETDLIPYAPGKLSSMTRDPLVMTFTIPLAPEVNLGAYRDVRIPFTVPEVTKKDVETAIEDMRSQQATLEPVDRPAQWDDVATLDIVGTLVDKAGKGKTDSVGDEDQTLVDRKAAQVLVGRDATYPVPGFPEHIVGISAGEESSFDIKVPARSKDVDEELRGNTYHFEVTCHEIHERDLPPLDDEFAKSVGEFENLAELHASVRRELEEQAEAATRSEYLDKIFDHLISSVVEVSYPPVMLEGQIDDMVKDFEERLQRQGLKVDDYLRLGNLTKESLREDFKAPAEMQLARALLLGSVVEAEGFRVSDEEIEGEIQNQLLSLGSQAAVAKQVLGSPKMRQEFARRILISKGLDRLVQIARGEAPSLEVDGSDENTNATPQTEGVEPESDIASDEVPTQSLAG